MVQSFARQGRMFGRYQLLLEMARGGMAALYLARLRGPESFEKMLVVKLIHEHLATEAEFTQMFLDEARITAMIHHPNVATVHEMGKEEDTYYLAIEYIHGQNLKDVLRSAVRNEGVWHWSHAVQVISEAAAGLHAAHELTGSDGKPMGVVHRDVSPQNILVSYAGDVKVIDFGIAYAAERLTQTRTGTVKGKAAYMSPEHVCGDILDRRSDIFSLATVLYESVTMRRLFRADNEAATLLRVRDCVVPPPRKSNPDLPVELERIILKALSEKPQDRYENAGDFSEDLQQCLVKSGTFVNRQQIGRTMEQLFHDRRVIREQQIKLAQEEETSYPQPALGIHSDTHASSTLAQVSELQRRAFRPSLLTVIGGALVVITVTALLVYLIGRDRWFRPDKGETNAAAASVNSRHGSSSMSGDSMQSSMQRDMIPQPPRGPADPPKYVPVTIEVQIQPEYAKPMVTFRGKKYPGRVFRMVVPKSTTEELVQIKAKGFHPESVFITANKDITEKVKLISDGTAAGRPPRPMRPMRYGTRTMRRRPRPMGGINDLIMDID